MTTFSRAILPIAATHPELPGPLIASAQSGAAQVRATQQVARVWTETYGVSSATEAVVNAFLAEINDLWRNGIVFDTYHPKLKNLGGLGGGTPLVNGGSQVGSSLITDGWTPSVAILKRGDVFRVAGLNLVYDITADASSNGSGQATLSINPPIYAGQSPANDAPLTINSTPGAVLFRCRLPKPEMPSAGLELRYAGLKLTFLEQVL